MSGILDGTDGPTLRYTLLIVALLIVGAVATVACAVHGKSSRVRNDVLASLAAAEQELGTKPDHPGARQQLAQHLYESGDFLRAADILRPLATSSTASPAVLQSAADSEYLLGRYAEAEALFQKLLSSPDANATHRLKAKLGLGFVFYQTNRFGRFTDLDFGRGVEFPGEKVLRSFERPPYRIEWQTVERTSEVPFLMTDPLPVMTVEYNGHPVHVLFDTGADVCILDSALAKEWGIAEVSQTVGGFGGGNLGKFGYGKLETVKVGDVTLDGVPIMIMPTQKFSRAFADGKHPIGGIIGTALARQFLTTLDYEHARLVLRPRSPQSGQQLQALLEGRIAAEVPFVLAATHLMMARGSLDGHAGLTFFVDSGLAADAAFAAPPQTLQLARIPEPEKSVRPESVGGGGGDWASGTFPIRSLGLGPLVQEDLKGEFGAMAAASYWQNGFIQDGLISHRFLRQYASWTIDFDRMVYVFAAEPRE